jgi:hypothetical protein
MPKTLELVPLEAVLQRVLGLLPNDAISEEQAEEWAYEAMESISPATIYTNEVTYQEVYNHKSPIPSGAKMLLMLMAHLPLMNVTTTGRLEAEVYHVDPPLYEIETKYLEYYTRATNKRWIPLAPSTNVFHNSILIKDSPNRLFNSCCNHTFTIDAKSRCIITSFSEGELAIAFRCLPRDEKGKYLIPDRESFKRALETYVLKRYWQYQMNLRSDGAGNLYQLYTREYEMLAPKATAELMMPDILDYQNLRNLNKFIREDSPFSNALGSLNNKETANFNNYSNHGNFGFYRTNL